MSVIANLSNHLDIALTKLDETIRVDLTKLPESSIQFLVCHGLKQRLGDSGAGLSDPAEIKARAMRTLEALYSGALRLSAPKDPLARETLLLAKKKAAAVDFAGRNPKEVDAAEWNAAVEKWANDKGVQKLAKMTVELMAG